MLCISNKVLNDCLQEPKPFNLLSINCFHRNLWAHLHCCFYRMASVQYKQRSLWKVSVYLQSSFFFFLSPWKHCWNCLRSFFSSHIDFESFVSPQLQQALQYRSSRLLIRSHRHQSPAWALWRTLAPPPCWLHPIRHPIALWGTVKTCHQAACPLNTTSKMLNWYTHNKVGNKPASYFFTSWVTWVSVNVMRNVHWAVLFFYSSLPSQQNNHAPSSVRTSNSSLLVSSMCT